MARIFRARLVAAATWEKLHVVWHISDQMYVPQVTHAMMTEATASYYHDVEAETIILVRMHDHDV